MFPARLRWLVVVLPLVFGGFICSDEDELVEARFMNTSDFPANLMAPGETIEDARTLLYPGETRDLILVRDAETISFRVNSQSGTFGVYTWKWKPGIADTGYGDGVIDQHIEFTWEDELVCSGRLLECPTF